MRSSHVARAFERILDVVRAIPRGRVMTYGQVAAVAGLPRGARVVAYALRAADRPVPWQRVVGLRRRGWGHITYQGPTGEGAALQRQLLEKERVRFTREDGIDLGRFGNEPG